MKNKNLSVEKLFLILSIVFGIMLIFIVPPFQSPDEDSHFLKSYLISNGDVYPKQEKKQIGFDIPEELDSYIREKQQFMGDLNKKYTYNDLYYEQLLSFSYNDTHFRDISTSPTTPIAHTVPAIGVKVASFSEAFNDAKDVGPAVLLQYARFMSLIVYSIIGFFAIKITPKFKKTFFTILMLPSSLFLRSMVTYDSLILVIVALSLAKMLQIYYDKKYEFKKKDMLLFIICGYILLNVKTVYSIIFLLMFIIPNKQFGGLKNKIKYYSIMVGAVLLLTVLFKIPYLQLDVPANDLISDQIKFVLNNPWEYIKIVFSNIAGQFRIQSYWMVGTYGLLDTYIPVLLLNIIYINLFAIIIYEIIAEKFELPLWINITYILLTVISIIAVYSSMYINWVPTITGKVGGSEITGVQGRYFLPYLFILPLIFSNKFVVKYTKKINDFLKKKCECINELYYLIPTLILIIVLITIFQRFWI